MDKIKITRRIGIVAATISLTCFVLLEIWDDYKPREYIKWDPQTLEIKEKVKSNKKQFEAHKLDTTGLITEENAKFYIQLDQSIDWVGLFQTLSSVMASCQGTKEPTPAPLPPPPTGPEPTPTPGQQDEVDWSYNYVHGKEANAITEATTDLIGIVDTGMDLNHPDLKGIVYAYANYTNEGSRADITDTVGHGTWIAGAIAGKNGNRGMRGLTQAKLIICKGLGENGGSIEGLVNCLDFVWKAGAKRINNSWGGGSRSQLLEAKLIEIVKSGVNVHFAAGNDGSVVSNPATFMPYLNQIRPNSAFAVRAVDQYGNKARFSNDGPEITNQAPGVNMKSTCPTNYSQMGQTYCVASGTSMATPLSAAIDSLAWSKGKTPKTLGPMKTSDAYESVK
jgi:hypothetical protein